MQNGVEIEDIEELRRREGIDDLDLRKEIRRLVIGDHVKLTFVTGSGEFETLRVRITSIRGYAFRGKLASSPASAALSNLQVGTAVVFTSTHIHSVLKKAALQ